MKGSLICKDLSNIICKYLKPTQKEHMEEQELQGWVNRGKPLGLEKISVNIQIIQIKEASQNTQKR
jgi:hypothetical protein